MKAADQNPVISGGRRASAEARLAPFLKGLIIDLPDVSYIDSVGEQLLTG